MSDKRKLYEVEVRVVYYAYTETPDAAADFVSEACKDAIDYSGCTNVVEVRDGDHALRDGWDRGCLIYTVGPEVKLSEALDKLPRRRA